MPSAGRHTTDPASVRVPVTVASGAKGYDGAVLAAVHEKLV